MTDETLTIKEAASTVSVSTETIRYWMKTGRLAYKLVENRTRVTRTDLLAACPVWRTRELQKAHTGNLLTVSSVSGMLRVHPSTIYLLVRKYGLEKIYVDKWAYLIDGDKLWDSLQDDPEHSYLTLRR